MKWFLERLTEPSSFAGVGMAAGGVLSILHAGADPAVAVSTILGGLAAFLIKEKSSTPAV